jgi:hypothetical protein
MASFLQPQEARKLRHLVDVKANYGLCKMASFGKKSFLPFGVPFRVRLLPPAVSSNPMTGATEFFRKNRRNRENRI